MADGLTFEAWTTTEVRVGCEGCRFGTTIEKPGLNGTMAAIACVNTGALNPGGVPVSIGESAETRTLDGGRVVALQLVSSTRNTFNNQLCQSACRSPEMVLRTAAAVAAVLQ